MFTPESMNSVEGGQKKIGEVIYFSQTGISMKTRNKERRLAPRPQPLPNLLVFRKTLVYYVRVSLLCTVFLFVIAWPLYITLASAWLEKGLSARSFFVVATTVLHVVLYWSCNGMTYWWHQSGMFARYRIGRVKREVPRRQLLIDTLKEAVVGQLIAEPAMLYFFVWPMYQFCGAPPIDAPLPSCWSTFASFAVAYFVHDWLFYWSHRLSHSATFYRHVHKQHHAYTGTIGFAAEFASPFEQIVSMKVPTGAGAFLAGCHPAIWLVWMSYRLCQTYEAHSGYCFYGSWLHSVGLTNSESAAFHDFHHTGNRGNFGFGPPAYLDHCFGTMDAWLAVGGIEGYLAQCKERAGLNKDT